MTALPEGWTLRRPTSDDVPALLALTHASDVAAVGEPDFTVDDVREALADPLGVVALDPAGTIVGWGYPNNPGGGHRDFIEVYVWPGRGLPAQRPLLALLIDRMRERAAALGHDPYEVRAGAIPTETPYIHALTDAGFVFVKQHARMQMSLDAIGTPPAPGGVSLRTVRAEDEAEMRAFHAVIEEAFLDSDHPSPGYDVWRRQLDDEETLSFDEWFVAEADGRIVGVLQSSDSGKPDGEGWVKRLAVLRPYRRRGVGEALLRRAFAVYAGKGCVKAGLGVDLANPTEAARLYHAVGMKPLYQANIYQISVRPSDLRS
nr:GNAT family N-acetyltransferase [uncultured Actinoplanes sp.]